MAAKEAARIYALALSGRLDVGRQRASSGAPLEQLVARWGIDLEADHDKRTAHEYQIVARAHWLPRWKRLDEITAASIADYTRSALRRVQRSSVRKEHSALRGFLRWCLEHGALAELPDVAPPATRATGVRATTRKREPVPLSPDDVDKIIAEIPERSRGVPARDYVTVLWETGLRPATVARLSVPEHYRRRGTTLRIAAELDKARMERVLDLSVRARQALDRHASGGPLFGKVNVRISLRDAAQRALGKRGAAVTVYDLRHARITGWLAASPNLPGVQYLAGHRHASTTARYVHPSREAAREVIAASGGRPARRRG